MKLSQLFAPIVLAAAVTSGCDSRGRPTTAGWILGGAAAGAAAGAIIDSTQPKDRGHGGYQNYPRQQPQYRVCQDRRGRQYYC